MNRTIFVMFGTMVLAGLLYMSMSTDFRPPESKDAIMLYCAASNRAVIEQIREQYKDECGRDVQIQYGPSQTLLSSIEVSKLGDLFLPADDSYLEMGREQSLISEVIPLARMQGVIVVKKGNPLGISSFDDLLREDRRLVQANDAAAIGKQTKRVLTASGLWDKLHESTTAYRTTVTDVANDVLVGAADAGIVYDAVLHTYPDLEYVEIPELKEIAADSAVGVISTSKNATAALHFARYVAARDRGLKQYKANGFRIGDGDAWADRPELSIFAGSMLRPAIEDTIAAFEQREGANITRVYNGCGILVAQMKAGQEPDAYFACDTEFMQQVTDLFPESVPVSQNELVILVEKGNPHNIRSLRDLTKPGVRVGIGHEKQCAMGWITQNTLKEGGVQEEVMSNVTVQTPTGDMLVNQLRTGSLDAAVAYLSNAAGSGEFLDAIRITDIDCSIATQPWAVAAESKYPQLASRLFEKICSAESQEVFAAEGFRWNTGIGQDGTQKE